MINVQNNSEHFITKPVTKSSANEYLHVEVRYPRTYRHEEKGKFTDYEIHIETNKIAFSRRSSSIRRRFSEFQWLRRQLASVEVNGVGKGSVPELPPKKIVGRFSPLFLEMRQKGLQDFLERILTINKFLSYSGLHLFLQSPMTVQEINSYLHGKYGEKSVEDMFEDFGCASNTDNPFSAFLSDSAPPWYINGRSYKKHVSNTSTGETLSTSSSDMSSGSFHGPQDL